MKSSQVAPEEHNWWSVPCRSWTSVRCSSGVRIATLRHAPENLGLIGKLQELVVQTAVEQGGEVLRFAVPGKVGTPDVPDK